MNAVSLLLHALFFVDYMLNIIQFCWFIAAEFPNCSIVSSLWTSMSLKLRVRKAIGNWIFLLSRLININTQKKLFNCPHTSSSSWNVNSIAVYLYIYEQLKQDRIYSSSHFVLLQFHIFMRIKREASIQSTWFWHSWTTRIIIIKSNPLWFCCNFHSFSFNRLEY